MRNSIEEMARTMCGIKEHSCAECVSGGLCEFWIEASVLYNAGYRKTAEAAGDQAVKVPKHPHYNCQRGMLCPTCDKALWTRVEIKGLFGTKKVAIKDQPNFCKYCGQALLAAYTEH